MAFPWLSHSIPEIHRQRRIGIALVVAAAIAWSTAPFFTRLLHYDSWTILFWRGAIGGIFIGGYVVWRHRNDTLAAIRAIGPVGLAIAACSTLGTICFINALRRTTVADVNVIYAAAPFVTASSRGSPTERRDWIAVNTSTPFNTD